MQAALVPEARAKIMELWLVNKLKGRVRLESDTLKYEEKDCGFWSKSACIRVAGSVELLGVLADIVDAHGETK